MHLNVRRSFKGMMLGIFFGGSLLAQTVTPAPDITDDPVAAMLDSLANKKIFERAFAKPSFPKNNKFHFAEDSVPRYDDFVYETRLAKLDASSPFDLIYNPHVKGFMELYTIRRRELVARMMGLSQLYYPMFEEVFDRYNIPLELKHLAVVESALNPNARSRAGATGLWQFMYPTGKMYGLNVTSYTDERSDPYKATIAAAEYLKSLYNMFGDWQMVLAAYNAGPGAISKAIRRSGGKKTYWEIRPYLPRETQAYVPAFIAANYVMNYTAEHNIYAAIPRKTYFEIDTVIVKQPMSFEQLSSFLDVPVDELQYFNPQYRKNIIPSGGYCLTLPKAKVGTFVANETAIYDALNNQVKESSGAMAVKEIQKSHTVRSGERLSSIAKKYGVTVADLKAWNYIGSKGIRPGKKLIIYVREDQAAKEPQPKLASNTVKKDTVGKDVKKLADNSSASKKPQQYKVRKGDTLSAISKKFGIPVSAIMDANGFSKSSKLQVGQVIRLN